MQKQSLIPTPLNPHHQARRKIDVVEPAPPSRWRFFAVTLFLFGTALRALFARLWSPWAKKNYTPLQNARRLRGFMEEMGGLWVKSGQIVALRRDLFEEEFCSELTRLQDRARGFPGTYARRIIEEDLGRSVEEIFSEFDESPLAAASIGQAHLARLRGSDTEVVIKVQRPNVRASIDSDLATLRIFVWFLTRLNLLPQFRWEDMYWEIENTIYEELDYRQEAATLRRMRKQLRSQKVYVPKVFLGLCSDRILVMEKVGGVYMSEYIQVAATDPERAQEWLRENQISARKAGERLLFSHFRQLLEDNLYHCDLHPGNILLMRRGRITLIDFGSVGSSDRNLTAKLTQMLVAQANRDYQQVADMYLLLCPALPNRDLSEAKEKIVRFYRELDTISKIKTIPYHQKSVSRLAGEVIKVLGGVGVSFPWDMLRSNRAELTLDAAIMYLLPDINYPKLMRRYLVGMRRRKQKRMWQTGSVRAQLAKVSEKIDMPTKLAENAYFEGEYLRRRAMKYAGYLSKASQIGTYVFHVLSRGALLAAFAAVGVLLHQRYGLLQRFRGTWLNGFLATLPHMEPALWLLVAGALVYISIEMTAIKGILDQAEFSKTGGERR